MFCHRCGNQIPDTAVICVHCGAAVSSKENDAYDAFEPEFDVTKESNASPAITNPVIAILGFIFSFVQPIAGLILAIIGLNKYDATLQPTQRKFSVAALVISIVGLALGLITDIIYLAFYEEIIEYYAEIFESSYYF